MEASFSIVSRCCQLDRRGFTTPRVSSAMHAARCRLLRLRIILPSQCIFPCVIRPLQHSASCILVADVSCCIHPAPLNTAPLHMVRRGMHLHSSNLDIKGGLRPLLCLLLSQKSHAHRIQVLRPSTCIRQISKASWSHCRRREATRLTSPAWSIAIGPLYMIKFKGTSH